MSAPDTQKVFVQVNWVDGNPSVLLFKDSTGRTPYGTDPLPINSPGTLEFYFISDNHSVVYTADLVIIVQYVNLQPGIDNRKRRSPFIPANTPVYFLPDPGISWPDSNGPSDANNYRNTLIRRPDNSIFCGSLKVAPNQAAGSTCEFSVCAIVNSDSTLVDVDPSIIINPP